MNRTSQCLRSVLLASAFVLLASHARPLEAMTANTVNSGDVESWLESGMDEVRRLVAPVPHLQFSPPPVSDNFWLAGEELRPFQERLSLEDKLTDLTDWPGVIDKAYYELVTTEGLIISERPFTAPQGAVWIRHAHQDRPARNSFWNKNQPVPSALRSMAFTRELLQEEDKLPPRDFTALTGTAFPSIMTRPSKLVRIAVLASSLTLLTVYMIHSQSRGRMAAPQTEKKFMLPSSKALTQPVFSTRKLESNPLAADPFATPAQKP